MSNIDSTIDLCLVVTSKEEIQVTPDQLKKIAKHLSTRELGEVKITNDGYKQIIKSPFPLREVCLEKFGLKHSDIVRYEEI